jgi:hypothetical protein
MLRDLYGAELNELMPGAEDAMSTLPERPQLAVA